MDNCRDSDKGWFKVISLGPCLSDIKDNFGVSSIKTLLANKVKMFFLRHYVLLKHFPYGLWVLKKQTTYSPNLVTSQGIILPFTITLLLCFLLSIAHIKDVCINWDKCGKFEFIDWGAQSFSFGQLENFRSGTFRPQKRLEQSGGVLLLRKCGGKKVIDTKKTNLLPGSD